MLQLQLHIAIMLTIHGVRSHFSTHVIRFQSRLRSLYYSERSEVYTWDSFMALRTTWKHRSSLWEHHNYLVYSPHFLIRLQSASKRAMTTWQQLLPNRSCPIQICCIYFKFTLSFVFGVTALSLSLMNENLVGCSQMDPTSPPSTV